MIIMIDDLGRKIQAEHDQQARMLLMFEQKMLEKYRNNRYGKNVVCVMMPSLDGKGGADIPVDIWKQEMKEFFKYYPHLMP